MDDFEYITKKIEVYEDPYTTDQNPFKSKKPEFRRWIPPQAFGGWTYPQIGTSVAGKDSKGKIIYPYGVTGRTPVNRQVLSLNGAWTTTKKKFIWVPSDCVLQARSTYGGLVEFRVINKDGEVTASGSIGQDQYKEIMEDIR